MNNSGITIYFDGDGVLANFKGYCDEHGIEYNPDNVRDKSVDKIMWDKIRKIPHFYDQLDPLPGSVELFKSLKKDYNCEVLTAIPKPDWHIDNCGEDKINWCHRYLGEDVKVHICYRAEKQTFVKSRKDVLVDDLACNIEEWERQGGTGILFTDAAHFDFDKLAGIALR